MIIFDGPLTANQPAQSLVFSPQFPLSPSFPQIIVTASSLNVGDYLTTGQTFDLSTALIGTIAGVSRVFPTELLSVSNRDFHLIKVVADSFQIFIYPGIDMHLKLEVT